MYDLTAEGQTCLPRVCGAGIASLSGGPPWPTALPALQTRSCFSQMQGTNFFFFLSFVLLFLKSLILGPTDSGGREEIGNTQPQSSVPVCV